MAGASWTAAVGEDLGKRDHAATALLRHMAAVYLRGSEAHQQAFEETYHVAIEPRVANMLRVIAPALEAQGFIWSANAVPRQGTVQLFTAPFMSPCLWWSVPAGSVKMELMMSPLHDTARSQHALHTRTVVDDIIGFAMIRRRSAWDGRSRHMSSPIQSSLEALNWVSQMTDEVKANARAIDEEWEAVHAKMAGRPSRTQG